MESSSYFDLLEKTLTFSLWPEPLRPVSIVARSDILAKTLRLLDRVTSRFGLRIAVDFPVRDESRENGDQWPVLAHTMVGRKRLRNIRELCAAVVQERIPGSFVECGVWRGGASMYARACLPISRPVYICDSFQGLPYDPNEPISANIDILKVPLKEVLRNFDAFRLHKNVIPVVGWFSDSLKNVPGPIAILRADGDMFMSTLAILKNLYHKVSPGGFVIIDDYYRCPECKRATDCFLEDQGLAPDFIRIDRDALFWRKAPLPAPNFETPMNPVREMPCLGGSHADRPRYLVTAERATQPA